MKLKFAIPLLLAVLAIVLIGSRQWEKHYYKSKIEYRDCQKNPPRFPSEWVLNTGDFETLKTQSKVRIDWSNTGLTNIPDSHFVGNFNCFRRLDLSDNALKAIPNAIQDLTNLREIDLSFNHINRFQPEFFPSLPLLEHIAVHHNNIDTFHLPPFSEKGTRYITIDLRENKITTIGKVSNTSNIFSIYLQNNQLARFPFELLRNETQQLDVSYNLIQNTTYPNEFTDNSTLEFLNLSNNKLTAYPAFLRFLTSLDRLNLNENAIGGEVLIQGLTNLGVFNIENQNVTTVTIDSFSLDYTNKIELNNNRIKEITIFPSLPVLKTLNLETNQLESVPKFWDKLKHLEILNLANNNIQIADFNKIDFIKLDELNLSYNQINTFTGLQDLIVQQLFLGDNQLKRIPEGFWSNPYIIQADFSDNQITKIHPFLLINQPQSRLIHLNLANNQITKIPAEIIQLTALTSLDLSSNPIESIDVKIFDEMPNFEQLILKNTQIPKEDMIGLRLALKQRDIELIHKD